MANISTFRSRIGQGRDLAKANRFLVNFNVPTGVSGAGTYGPDLPYLCETAELPGRALDTQEYRYYGPKFRMPHQSAYTDINFTIYLRSFMQDKKLFDNWLDYINPKNTYDFKFRNQYSTSVEIWQFEEMSDKPSYKITLNKAYPINVNPVPLSWSEDNIHRLQVTFCYVDWRKDDDPKPTGTSTIDNFFDQLKESSRILNSSQGGRTTVGGGV